jgi:3-deoxy-manno-octulosonate cytidylyltransferase (CMP-KDO synthetase)
MKGTIAIIPARYASERLPGKPLADICGKPMIQHVVERTARARRIDGVCVATDDERIAAAVRAFGGTVVMTPADLRSGSDRVAYVAQSMPDAALIVNVQGDEPLIAPGMIDEAVEPLLQDPLIVAGTVVRALTTDDEIMNPATAKVVLDREGFCLYFSRSPIPHVRDLPPAAWRSSTTIYKHIGLYVYRRAFLLTYASLPQTPLERAEKLEQLRMQEHGYRIRAVVTAHDSIPVDTPADLARVRTLMGTLP